MNEGLLSRMAALSLQMLHTHLFQKFALNLVEFFGKIDVDFVGVDESSGFVPEGLLFLFADFLDLHDAGRGVYTFALFEYRNQQLPYMVSAAL